MDKCREILTSGLIVFEKTHPSEDWQSSEKLESLLKFITLIEKWNQTYNLTAIRDKEEMTRLHILDSLAILPYLHGKRLIDIGTGAGLPGIPLAIYRPEMEFVLLDSNSKKTRFVQQAILELKLKNITVINSRVENYQPSQKFDTIVSRAFASMDDILKLTAHLLAENGILLAMKGQQPVEELASLQRPFKIIPLHVPQLKADRCLVCISCK